MFAFQRGRKFFNQCFYFLAGDICPCLVLPESFKSALAQMLDVSLMKDPVFMMIAISNLFGMAGLYVPFFYLVDSATLKVTCFTLIISDFISIFYFQGIDKETATLLLSVIGVTNTLGRIGCGYFADFPQVNALLVNNVCLVTATLAVGLTPLCSSFGTFVVMAIFFGIAICKYLNL